MQEFFIRIWEYFLKIGQLQLWEQALLIALSITTALLLYLAVHKSRHPRRVDLQEHTWIIKDE
jgi:hypothetical protein